MIRITGFKTIILIFIFSGLFWLGCGDDDNNNTGPQNNPPVISSITANPDTFVANQLTTIIVMANDPDGDALNYNWESRGSWLTPVSGGANTIELTNCCEIIEPDSTFVLSIVDDSRGGVARDSIMVWILLAGK